MPFVLVETKNAAGSKKLLAAPASWILRCKETFYLRWPTHVRDANSLSAMLADETNVPSTEWERRECKVICKNIKSYASAQDLVEKRKLHSIQTLDVYTKEVAVPTPAEIQYDAPTKEMLMGMMENLQTEIMPELMGSINPKREQDPLRLSEAIDVAETVAHEQRRSNRKKQFSTINANPLETDPLEDVKPFPQLLDLIYELKCMIVSNQEEIRKKLNEGFNRMQKTMLSMVSNKPTENVITAQDTPTVGTTAYKDDSSLGNADIDCDFADYPDAFNLTAFTRREELDAFEDRLNDEEYRRRVYSWINHIVPYEANPETRMMDILDLLMDRKFFTKFSWKSNRRYRKIPLSEYVNFCQLFQYVGTTQVHRADAAFVEYFFKKKMKHALERIHLRGLRRCVAKRLPRHKHCGKNAMDNSTKSDQTPSTESEGLMEVEHDTGTCLPETNQASPLSTTEIVVVDVNPITCEDGMVDFDTQLGNEDYLKEVHRWIDTSVGHLTDPEQRMREILEKLIDRSFLLNFKWTKETIVRYANFVRLLEYVGTTAQHQISHTFVAIFLRNKLKPFGSCSWR